MSDRGAGPSRGSRAYRAAISGTVGTEDEMLTMQAFALMAICDAAPVWTEQVGATPEVAVVTVSDASVIAAKLAIAYAQTATGATGATSGGGRP